MSVGGSSAGTAGSSRGNEAGQSSSHAGDGGHSGSIPGSSGGAGGSSAGALNAGGTGGTSAGRSGAAGATTAGASASPGGTSSGGTPPIDDAGGEAGASEGGAGSGSSPSDCEFSGHVTYKLNRPETWPADLVPLITRAMDEATKYYNCYADLSKEITVNYKSGVPTAEANVDGVLSFGSNKSYMQVATAMHEVAHTLGVGYYPWAELLNNGRWIGPNVDAFMKALPKEQRDPDMYSQRDYITADSQHFWPYGLNQASEHQSEWSLINHVRIVALMQLDKKAHRDGEL